MKELSIIFDVDGTLWDAVDEIADSWNLALERHPKVKIRMTGESLQEQMGKTQEAIRNSLFPELSEKEKIDIMEEMSLVEIDYLARHGAKIYPGLTETLEKLYKDYRLFVVSNGQDGYVQAFIKACKYEKYFTDIEMYGRTELEKGDNIKLLMERNNVTKAVYVGDTLGDEDSARYAGIPFIYAEYGFGEAKSPDKTIGSIGELVECIKTFE